MDELLEGAAQEIRRSRGAFPERGGTITAGVGGETAQGGAESGKGLADRHISIVQELEVYK